MTSISRRLKVSLITPSKTDVSYSYFEFLYLGLIEHGEHIGGGPLGAGPMLLLGLRTGHLGGLETETGGSDDKRVGCGGTVKNSTARCGDLTNNYA